MASLKKQREYNFDLLRVLATVAVVCTHVTSKYISAATKPGIFGEVYTDHLWVTCLYNVFAWFAVPCFVMLSGAFCLSDPNNRNYAVFYKKSWRKIGIPTVVFSVLYCLFSICLDFYNSAAYGISRQGIRAPIQALLRGEPYYHMWYLYMLIGLYLMVPVLVGVRETLGKKHFRTVTWIVMIWSMLSLYSSTHKNYWDIGLSACYIGYFMLGLVLRENAERKSNKKALLFILLAVAVLTAGAWYRYNVLQYSVTKGLEGFKQYISVKPINTVASVLLFCGFSYLDIKGGKFLAFLSKHSFMTYLFHAGVWTVLFQLINDYLPWKNYIVIPVCILLVYGISTVAAVLCEKIMRKRK